MDGYWMWIVCRVFSIWTPDPSTVVRVIALETGRGSSTWVWLAGATACHRANRNQASPARPTTVEETLRSSNMCERALAASFLAFSVGLTVVPTASADDVTVDGSDSGAVQVAAGPTSDSATPAALQACGQFAEVLDGSSNYYGEFADSFEGSSYSDPAVDSSNEVGRTALRQSAAVAMSASNTAGLDPSIASPMRVWSLGATKLLLKMGLRIPGDSLNSTATEMNNQAEKVQEACAAAGTHA